MSRVEVRRKRQCLELEVDGLLYLDVRHGGTFEIGEDFYSYSYFCYCVKISLDNPYFPGIKSRVHFKFPLKKYDRDHSALFLPFQQACVCESKATAPYQT